MALPAIGEVFAGKYAIEAVVGRGGMGVVLAARHIELDEKVAIKLILADEGRTDADFVARFVREAKLASKIKSEHVVRVLDVARLETGEPYIVMELLEGRDLAALLEAQGPLPIEQVALYVLQACEAIAEAHALGIVHRDLKPANLFLTTRRDGRPCVKVLDFGISKLLGEAGAQAMTQTDTLMGSPLYMSPEQLISPRDLDARSDVWALGVILFELLTQRGPFDGEDAPHVIAQILHRPPPSLHDLRPGLPPELSALIEGALVKEREQRIPNVAELSRGLVAFAPDLGRYSFERITGLLSRSGVTPASGVTGRRWGDGSGVVAGTPASATASGASLDLGASPKRSSLWPVLAGAAVLIVFAGVAAWSLIGRVSAPVTAASGAQASASAGVAVPAPELPTPTPKAPEQPSPYVDEPVATAAPVATSAPAEPKPRPKPFGAAPKSPQGAQAKPVGAAPANPFGGVR